MKPSRCKSANPKSKLPQSCHACRIKYGVCVCSYRYTCMLRPEVDRKCLLKSLFTFFFFFFLILCLSSNLELTLLTRLTGQQASGVLPLPAPGFLLPYPLPAPGVHSGFYMGAGDPNCSPLARMASTFPTEFSPQP